MPTTHNPFRKTKYSCFYTYLAMSSAFSFPPILFVTFREMYGISYTLLGSLVLINFCTQLLVDLVFTFFTKHFNIHKTIRTMPLLTSIGLLIYAGFPTIFPQYAYAGLVIGTIVFSIAAGLCEVMLSPLVAALPSENPERDMSALHSLYAYGVLMVVSVSTLFLKIFGRENWMYLAIFWAILPVISSILFHTSPLPQMDLAHSSSAGSAKRRNTGMALCVLCIFLGSAAENTMTNWISGFMENSLHIPKALGDLIGLSTFAVLLGLTRTAYAKFGKNIYKVLVWGMAGAIVCYLIVGFSSNIILSICACVLTGVCTSMLWPGALILMEEKLPGAGVTAYALMAAGGDLGASIAPQLMGVVVDTVSASQWASLFSPQLGLSPEQLGMKTGMLISAIFPMLGLLALLLLRNYFRKHPN